MMLVEWKAFLARTGILNDVRVINPKDRNTAKRRNGFAKRAGAAWVNMKNITLAMSTLEVVLWARAIDDSLGYSHYSLFVMTLV